MENQVELGSGRTWKWITPYKPPFALKPRQQPGRCKKSGKQFRALSRIAKWPRIDGSNSMTIVFGGNSPIFGRKIDYNDTSVG
jgi:hypothetical protein